MQTYSRVSSKPPGDGLPPVEAMVDNGPISVQIPPNASLTTTPLASERSVNVGTKQIDCVERFLQASLYSERVFE